MELVIKVWIYNINIKKVIVVEVEVENGKVKIEGFCMIFGVLGMGLFIYFLFENGEGVVIGKLFLIGNVIDFL